MGSKDICRYRNWYLAAWEADPPLQHPPQAPSIDPTAKSQHRTCGICDLGQRERRVPGLQARGSRCYRGGLV
eukprot:1545061-Rhodomonas_salina.6